MLAPLELAVAAALAALSVVLVVIDAGEHRLPNRWVFSAWAVLAAGVTADAVLRGSGAASGRAALGAAILFGGYLLLRAVFGGVGGGDVKLAAAVGAALAWVGWRAFVVGTAGAFVLGGIAALAVVCTRRGGRHTAIAFGPWMIIGAWVGILAESLRSG